MDHDVANTIFRQRYLLNQTLISVNNFEKSKVYFNEILIDMFSFVLNVITSTKVLEVSIILASSINTTPYIVESDYQSLISVFFYAELFLILLRVLHMKERIILKGALQYTLLFSKL